MAKKTEARYFTVAGAAEISPDERKEIRDLVREILERHPGAVVVTGGDEGVAAAAEDAVISMLPEKGKTSLRMMKIIPWEGYGGQSGKETGTVLFGNGDSMILPDDAKDYTTVSEAFLTAREAEMKSRGMEKIRAREAAEIMIPGSDTLTSFMLICADMGDDGEVRGNAGHAVRMFRALHPEGTVYNTRRKNDVARLRRNLLSEGASFPTSLHVPGRRKKPIAPSVAASVREHGISLRTGGEIPEGWAASLGLAENSRRVQGYLETVDAEVMRKEHESRITSDGDKNLSVFGGNRALVMMSESDRDTDDFIMSVGELISSSPMKLDVMDHGYHVRRAEPGGEGGRSREDNRAFMLLNPDDTGALPVSSLMKTSLMVSRGFLESLPATPGFAPIRKLGEYCLKNSVRLTGLSRDDEQLIWLKSGSGVPVRELRDLVRYYTYLSYCREAGAHVCAVSCLRPGRNHYPEYVRHFALSDESGFLTYSDVHEPATMESVYEKVASSICESLQTPARKMLFDPDYVLPRPYVMKDRSFRTVREGINAAFEEAENGRRRRGAHAVTDTERTEMALTVTEKALEAQPPVTDRKGTGHNALELYRQTLLDDAFVRANRFVKGLTVPGVKGGIRIYRAYRDFFASRMENDPRWKHRAELCLSSKLSDGIPAEPGSGNALRPPLLGESMTRGIAGGMDRNEAVSLMTGNLMRILSADRKLGTVFDSLTRDEASVLFSPSSNPSEILPEDDPCHAASVSVRAFQSRNSSLIREAFLRARVFRKYPALCPYTELAVPATMRTSDKSGTEHVFSVRSPDACMRLMALKRKGGESRTEEELSKCAEICAGSQGRSEWFDFSGDREAMIRGITERLARLNPAWRKAVVSDAEELSESSVSYLNGLYGMMYGSGKKGGRLFSLMVDTAGKTDRDEEIRLAALAEKMGNAGLTDDQRMCVSAITDGQGGQNILLLAGAGSGKTRVLVRTVYELLRKGTPPESVVMFTFTNEAADEFRQRLETLVKADPALAGTPLPSVSTAHSYALNLLRNHCSEAGLPEGFRIAETSTLIRCMGQSMDQAVQPVLRRKTGGKQDVIRRMVEFISKIKAQGLCGLASLDRELPRNGEFLAQLDASSLFDAWKDRPSKIKAFEECYGIYQNTLKTNGMIDLSDIMIKTVGLLVANEDVRRNVRARTGYLLVDEIQDANVLLLQLMGMVAGENTRTICAGDTNQNIYRYMNSGKYSDGRSIVEFLCDDPARGFRKLFLNENLRSTSELVSFGNEIKKLSGVHDDGYTSVPGIREGEIRHGEKPKVFISGDRDARWEYILSNAEKASEEKKGSVMILCRTNREIAELREYALEHHPSMRFAGNGKTAFSPTHDDVIAVMDILSHPEGAVQFAGMFNHLARTRLKALPLVDSAGFADAHEVSDTLAESSPLAEKTVAAIRETVDSIISFNRECNGAMKASEATERFFTALADKDIITPEQVPGHHETETVCSSRYLSEASRLIDLIELQREDQKFRSGKLPDGVVSLMTIHASKGLEAGTVFISDAASIVSGRTDNLMQDADEGKRTYYVAVTRATDTLHVCGRDDSIIHGVDPSCYERISTGGRSITAKDSAEALRLSLEDDEDGTSWIPVQEEHKATLGPVPISSGMKKGESPVMRNDRPSRKFSPTAVARSDEGMSRRQ